MIHVLGNDELLSDAITKTCETSSTRTNIDTASHNCSLCGRVFRREEDLEQHIISKHSAYLNTDDSEKLTLANSVPQDLLLRENLLENSANKKFECLICGLLFASYEDLERHQSHLFQPMQNDESFQCINCEKSFSNQRALTQHTNFCYSKKCHQNHKIDLNNSI
jgi:uncharacterized C2H2 Zn-finger protein